VRSLPLFAHVKTRLALMIFMISYQILKTTSTERKTIPLLQSLLQQMMPSKANQTISREELHQVPQTPIPFDLHLMPTLTKSSVSTVTNPTIQQKFATNCTDTQNVQRALWHIMPILHLVQHHMIG
jgi:hypothetical protein